MPIIIDAEQNDGYAGSQDREQLPGSEAPEGLHNPMVKSGLSMKSASVAALVMFAIAEVPSLASPQSTAPQKTSAKNSSKHRRKTQAAAYQLHPAPERYQEIQKALSEKGYFKGEVNGQWTDDSIDALKRFQADQKLEADGKINSLTLIALGLGPKHDASAPAAPAVVSVPPPPPQ